MIRNWLSIGLRDGGRRTFIEARTSHRLPTGARWTIGKEYPSRTEYARTIALTPVRAFSNKSQPPKDADFSKERSFEDANPERIHGIQVNPDSIGDQVLPGKLVYKHYKWTGNTRKVPLELVHGYFWMLNDLKKTNGKPLLSNEKLIPEDQAQVFPILTGLETLGKVKTDIPYFFIEDEGKNFTG